IGGLSAAALLQPVVREQEIDDAHHSATAWVFTEPWRPDRCEETVVACFSATPDPIGCQRELFGSPTCSFEPLLVLRDDFFAELIDRGEPHHVLTMVASLDHPEQHVRTLEEALASPHTTAEALEDLRWPSMHASIAKSVREHAGAVLWNLRHEPVSLVAHHRLFEDFLSTCDSLVECLRGVRERSRRSLSTLALFSVRAREFDEATMDTRRDAPRTVVDLALEEMRDLAVALAIRIRRAREACEPFESLSILPEPLRVDETTPGVLRILAPAEAGTSDPLFVLVCPGADLSALKVSHLRPSWECSLP
ncbi:MAG: hypothetical protein AAGE52_43000, partial [Myxococcota bacterium]